MGAKSVADSLLFLRHPDGQWLVGWGEMYRAAQAPSDRPAFFLPDFFGDDPNPWWIPELFQEFTRNDLLKKWPPLASSAPSEPGDRTPRGWQWQDPAQALFNAEIGELLETIARGGLRKAVPIVMSEAARLPSESDKFAWWAHTLHVPSRWIAYGGWWADEGLIGLSPEILFNSAPGWTETMALAGTAPNPGPSLFESEKDQREHQLVVDDIAQQLSELGEVKKTPTREWLLGRLKHLRTDMAIADDFEFMRLVRLLHPTPALGVSPREAGLGFLRKSAFAKTRRRFGAPFGVNVPNQLALCCVAIRGLQWHEDKTWLSSGCGVVAGSNPEKEWQELKLKRAVVAEQFAVQGLV